MELKIKVQKDRLLDILKTNMIKHKADYIIALANWKKEVKDTITEQLNLLTQTEDYSTYSTKDNKIFKMDPAPKTYEKEYQHTIDMLEFCSDQEIVLTSHQYDAYVKDQWSWKDNWMYSNGKYLSITK